MTRQPRRPAGIELEAAAQRAHLPTSSVRRYVRRGLVRPTRVKGGPVLFDEIEIARLRRIRRLVQDLGLNSAGIEVVLRLVDQIEALQRELDGRSGVERLEVRRWQ
jgi:MerR family transcriptional regulator/heat shock protein HspR